ncbi:hypothetical protein IAQ61_011175 [Plenodomus lingam]|uniref:uncharacterized protein n=1 Tax=Leptosphaeria maculans TaxID=5022 RepID=UPI003319FBA1|nr:hypothetical protein IAQ61_011175 [Plenodomus lingam]
MLKQGIAMLRSPSAMTMLFKIVVVIIILGSLFHLRFLVSLWDTSPAEYGSHHASLSEGLQAGETGNGSQNVGQGSNFKTIDHASIVHTSESSGPPPPAVVESPSSESSHETANMEPVIADKLLSSHEESRFRSHGPKNCFPSFDTTMQQHASDRLASCEKYAPFSIEETHRVAFATASTGGPLSPAYALAIQSHMTHSTIHNSTVHMLCADIVPGIWNKVAYLQNLVSEELLKPERERLEWLFWADRDTLILDQCRPLSSFLPPKSPEFDKVNFLAIHDAYGLNYGVFFIRVNTWAINFFYNILSYPYYKPQDELIFAEQSAAARLLEADPKYGDHFARVPWYWFNAYPMDDDNGTIPYVSNVHPDEYEYFRPRKGDFLAHFAGHGKRLEEMVTWAYALEKVGDVWVNKEEEERRDVTSDIGNYWRAYKEGTLTDKMKTGKSANDEAKEKVVAAAKAAAEAEKKAKEAEEQAKEAEKQAKEAEKKAKEAEEAKANVEAEGKVEAEKNAKANTEKADPVPATEPQQQAQTQDQTQELQ